MNLRNFLICLLMLPALFSCQEPVRDFCFVELNQTTGLDAPVTLSLYINATAEPQQLDLSARLYEYERYFKEIPLVISIKSPSGLVNNDTIALPVKARGYMTLSWVYRKNILNKEPGVWNFTISPLDKREYRTIYDNITGLGISCKKEEK